MNQKIKIALVISHPIQHFCPQYVSFAKNDAIIFKVFFGSILGLQKYFDPQFKQEITWTDLGLEHFDHVFLNGEAILPSDKNLDATNLEEELSSFNPDVIITYGYFQKLQRRAKNWAKKYKKKIVYISDTQIRQKRPMWKWILSYPSIYNYFKQIDYFFTVGNANEDYYRFYKVKKQKFIRMHFSIDIENYRKAYAIKTKLRELIRIQQSISPSAIVFTTVGKLVSSKNHSDIIMAMEILENQGYISELLIIGSGEMLDSLKHISTRLQKSKVHFMGFIKPNELPSFYAASDIYVHPASVEAHSLAISEAIYMACPVVLSANCGSYGATDDVQIDFNGQIFETGNVENLAFVLKNLMNDKEKLRLFGERSHNLGVNFQNCAHNKVIDKLIDQINIKM